MIKKTVLQELTSDYAKLVEKENAIDAQKKIIAGKIKENLKVVGVTSVTMPQGIFSIVVTSVWSFSKKVVKLDEQLKLLKEKEKESGVAFQTPSSESMRFTPKK